MKLLKYSLFFVFALALTGCSFFHRNDRATDVHPVMPVRGTTDSQLSPKQNYYPVPSDSSGTKAPPVSLEPPGGRYHQYRESKNNTAKSNVTASLSDNEQQLVIAASLKKTYQNVGKALKATPYHVLDKDPSMNAYFILDSTITGNKVTQNTPIYRLYLTAKDGKTLVMLKNRNNQSLDADITKRILLALQQKLV